VVDKGSRKQQIVLDASPLIYLAKLEALEVFEVGNFEPLVPPHVIDEVATPALIYRHPDAMAIEEAARRGLLSPISLAVAEEHNAHRLSKQLPGMHVGECQVLAVAIERSIPAVIFERRGRSVARALGVELVDVIELVFGGTRDFIRLETRIKQLAALVNMRLADFEALRAKIERRRLQ
jgi:predicted nucleic acid-binding protein